MQCLSAQGALYLFFQILWAPYGRYVVWDFCCWSRAWDGHASLVIRCRGPLTTWQRVFTSLTCKFYSFVVETMFQLQASKLRSRSLELEALHFLLSMLKSILGGDEAGVKSVQ